MEEVQQRTRKYRSKIQRPCDLCRSRKIQCKRPNDASACQKCSELSRQCTFVLEPLKKKARAVEKPSEGESVPAQYAELQALIHGDDYNSANGLHTWGLLENNQVEDGRPVEDVNFLRGPLGSPKLPMGKRR